MQPLTIDDFTPHIGKIAHFAGTPFAFPIDRVLGGGEPAAHAPRAQFTIIFRGPKTPVMAEGLYTCEIEGGPTHTLYVMPVHTPQTDCQEYQAAFN